MPLALLALAALHFLGSNTSPAPVSKLELVRGLVSFQYQRDLIRIVGERGVDFVLDVDLENMLMHSGASKELLSSTRSAHLVFLGTESIIENQAIACLSKCAELEHKGQSGGVAEECEPALKLLPNNVYVLTAVSYALAHDFRSIEALPYIQQAARLAPESSEVHRIYADVRAHADAKEMEEEEKEGDRENEAHAQKYQERFDFAVSEYLEAVRLDPDNTIAHFELGRHYGSDQADRALVEFREVARLDPTSAYVLCEAGEILAGQDKLDEALVEFGKAEKTDPGFTRAYQQRAEILAIKERYDEAIREAKKAIELEPKFMPSKLTLSNVYMRGGDFEPAMSVLHEAALSDHDNPTPSLYMAGYLYDKGDWDGANTVLREAIRMSPKLGYLHAELAAMLEEEADYGNALGEYQEVMKLSGDSTELQTAIKRVKSKLSNARSESVSESNLY